MWAATISGMAEITCCAVTATVSPFALSRSHTSIRPSESGLILTAEALTEAGFSKRILFSDGHCQPSCKPA